jgi:hypothetical protein
VQVLSANGRKRSVGSRISRLRTGISSAGLRDEGGYALGDKVASSPLFFLLQPFPILAHFKLGFIPYLSLFTSFVLHNFERLSAFCGCACEVEDPPSPPSSPS